MDIPLLSIALSQGKVQQQVGVSLLKQNLGQAEQQGQAIQKLMSSADVNAIERAVHPHLGHSIDIKL
ncbi:hypothetical protein AJ85_03490 [Alkalihalobacillus alcalophilus ATCC 27647 = CGMCC 1.3604]|uniref:Motility protein n=1 Tax=Alkalihalobacillus alcalophilus ATCC 27647 = CGMCC 1.3604 TaxID=1218173 RepID=A0A094WK49_ALKAL|nr:YjfB family protein [Alkalihalobacillus alcalophilus]KGA97216.1 hypothetical protein BALCAV_0211450 [Alkalihalobacillus alcalophilus ATCC 27647 = CGMCC 1.3604]MED1561541.1 YjfB family protein [Alkalihalobacillus alcalophilus]THG88444.1 hypothetical protein AJ85_03490 [Alkalihalobacillus alcalophilus ATCC 27647 = CGMCC 1.3604]